MLVPEAVVIVVPVAVVTAAGVPDEGTQEILVNVPERAPHPPVCARTGIEQNRIAPTCVIRITEEPAGMVNCTFKASFPMIDFIGLSVKESTSEGKLKVNHRTNRIF
jgi:hypothetical protein